MKVSTASLVVAAGILLMPVARAHADCPAPCTSGGGPAATDCFVEYSGLAAPIASCTDGDTCDQDGKADGICTFPLSICINVAGGACTPGTLSAPPAVKRAKGLDVSALNTGIASLDLAASGCTTSGFPVPVKVGLPGLKNGVARLTVTATSGGKRDTDKLRLTCMPSTVAPSLANDVQPILTAKCAILSCHSGPSPSAGQSLEVGQAYGTDVNQPSTDLPRFIRVKPGSLMQSFMARKILGRGIPLAIGGALMPQGCPGAPPDGGCLTAAETYTILSWIQNGAPDN